MTDKGSYGQTKPAFDRVQEFIQALEEEISAIKKGKGGSIVKVFDGRFLTETAGFFVYMFHLENVLVVLDDTPAEIEIAGRNYRCQVVSVQGLDVQIGIEEFVGRYVAEGKLQTNLWYLLDLLRKKYEESLPIADKVFAFGEKLFSGKAESLEATPAGPEYGRVKHPPNRSQEQAIQACFSKSLAIIWGPPGTGKTQTISKAIEAHLKAGRRVLLVSHANVAVDEALEKVAEQLKSDPLYNEGKLVRLGIPHKDSLKNDYWMVIPERIVDELAKPLVDEKTKLSSQKNELNEKLQALDTVIAKLQELAKIRQDIDALERSVTELTDRIDEIDFLLSGKTDALERNRVKLKEAKQSSTLKRFFKGLNAEKIQKQIDYSMIAIETDRRVRSECEIKSTATKSMLEAKKNDLRRMSAEVVRHTGIQSITEESLLKQKSESEAQIAANESRIKDIERKLEELKANILNEARLVATTLTKTYTAREFPSFPFDVIIVDESSMAPLPHLYWAASKASKAITIVGDFLQLPPIRIADSDTAKQWLGRSIYNILGIDTISEAEKDTRVTLLATQYRMHPKISDIPNRLFYGGKLNDAKETSAHENVQDSFSGYEALTLIDTSSANPWCSQLSQGGRFNLYSALICVSLAHKLVPDYESKEIGILCPYKAQTRLISKIAEDRGILDKIRIGTVHTFQGGEAKAMIIDCVEGPGGKRWSMLDEVKSNPDARLLLNVAFSRAKAKVYLVAHSDHLRQLFSERTSLIQILDLFKTTGVMVPSEHVVPNYVTDDFEKWAEDLMGKANEPMPFTEALYTEKNFWPVFLTDLKSATNSVIIVSPFISLNRAGRLMNLFRTLLVRNVGIRIYTRPPSGQPDSLFEQSGVVLTEFRKIGATLILKQKLHQKVALIDGKITWEGSLNILSHKDSTEQMRRIEGTKTACEIIRDLELDQDDAAGTLTDELCPLCLKRGIESPLVIRQGPNRRRFIACSSWPKTRCPYKEDLSKWKRHKHQS